jgi:hypothetical protein
MPKGSNQLLSLGMGSEHEHIEQVSSGRATANGDGKNRDRVSW